MAFRISVLLLSIILLIPGTSKGFVQTLRTGGPISEILYKDADKRSSPGVLSGTSNIQVILKRTFLTRVILKRMLRWKLKRMQRNETGKKSKGLLPLILSIAGIISVFIPVLLPAAMVILPVAIIYGTRVKRKYPEDKTAATAVTLGWIGLVLLAGALLISLVNSFEYWKFG